MAALSSAGGVIALLHEERPELKIYALKGLNDLVSDFWAEISNSVSEIETLSEDDQFAEKELAALVASKVYYHLGELDESVKFALRAGDHFNLSENSEYVETMISKCIDMYIMQQTTPDADRSFDPKIVVERMFRRCEEHGQFEQAIGIALETLRLDVVKDMIQKGDKNKLLAYVLDVSMTLVQDVEFRNKVLTLLVSLYETLDKPDYFAVGQCYVHLNSHDDCAKLLTKLVKKEEQLIAYQLAFDLEESATQDFLAKVSKHLDELDSSASTAVENQQEAAKDPYTKIKSILSGKETIQLHLRFLSRNNHTDMKILEDTKGGLESRLSIHHSAVTYANAFMHAGTTIENFIRKNLGWFERASNWARFSAVAALGVIHKGQLDESQKLLKEFLPSDSPTNRSFYAEGGSLYALGLINANHGSNVLDYLRDQLTKAATEGDKGEVLQHGACLGLGVAGMATQNSDIYEELNNTLHSDSAVAGEAAGLAMGLVMLGTASKDAIEEMLQYAHETQHEKIIRGLAVGLSLIMYNKEEQADDLINTLLDDKDPILRYGGVYTVAMAYVATGSNKAIRRLLHVAVSDVNDDVRRAAVTALGFILLRTPKQVPRVVQLLAESYNPHVRYGATLALGIACAGTGDLDALKLLEPMSKDPVGFVRQGAWIAHAMILIQQTESTNSKVAGTRKLFEKVIGDKHEDPETKFGAVLAQGIIDAGGRNVTISLLSRTGHANMSAIVGMALFTQFWYWYPLTHMLSLAFTPTAIIGLNKDLKTPKTNFVSNVQPSLYAYPPAIKDGGIHKVEKVAAAVLSTTEKVKARDKKGKGDEMDVDMPAEGTDKKEEEEEKAEEEATFEILPNLSRVVPSQLKYISCQDGSRYEPVKPARRGGILLMLDKTPDQPEELDEEPVIEKDAAAATEGNAPPFEPFEYFES